MKILMSCFLFTIITLEFKYCNAQDSTYLVEVDSVETTNNCFKEILDSIISNEMRCAYYRPSLSFGIDIYSISDDSIMCTFFSLINPSYFLEKKPVGFFRYDDHLFIIQESLIKGVLSKSGTKGKFRVSVDKSENIYIAVDDGYSVRDYFYINGRFKYANSSPPCPK